MTTTKRPGAPIGSHVQPARRTAEQRLARALPLAGVAFAVLSAIGNLTIGDFPDSNTSTAKLTSFYATHHASVAHGGLLLGYATVCFAFFGIALWWRVRRSSASGILAGAVLVGSALVAVGLMIGADTYLNLGNVSTKANITPAALQALHIGGAVGGTGADSVVFLLAVAAAGILSRALPGWLAWSALVLAIMHLTPLGFLAYLLMHLWAVAAGIALFARPLPQPAPEPASGTSSRT
jgi:hypothetical protein